MSDTVLVDDRYEVSLMYNHGAYIRIYEPKTEDYIQITSEQLETAHNPSKIGRTFGKVTSGKSERL